MSRLLLPLLAVSVVLCAFLLSPSFTFYQIVFNSDAHSSERRSSADVTAVLLNWARLPNLVQIVFQLCSLDTVIREIIVWNNNPRPLGYNEFADSNCSSNVLRIHNSPENVYFHARYIACANASTPYCFIQDDDYLVAPEVIHSLRARVEDSDIFLLPPHEVLSSRLLSINSPSSGVNFAFSWLGYGALISKIHAESFLSLLGRLGMSQEETRMADNYYSILRNSLPEIWTAAPIALPDEGAFTVGDEGVARNRKHIAAAAKYLDAISAGTSQDWPYVSLEPSKLESAMERSPCLGRPCLLESNIQSLPYVLDTDLYKTAGELFYREEQLSSTLSTEATSTYLNFPLSHAVDSNPDTFFRSIWNVAEADTLVLDVFDAVPDGGSKNIDWLWLVNVDTAQVLSASTYSHSSDHVSWIESQGPVSCTTRSSVNGVSSLEECRIPMDISTLHRARYLRLQCNQANLTFPWIIHEIWLHVEP